MVERVSTEEMDVVRRTRAQETGVVESLAEFVARSGGNPQDALMRCTNGTGAIIKATEVVTPKRVTAVDKKDYFPNF